jgi:hypothetical protein
MARIRQVKRAKPVRRRARRKLKPGAVVEFIVQVGGHVDMARVLVWHPGVTISFLWCQGPTYQAPEVLIPEVLTEGRID